MHTESQSTLPCNSYLHNNDAHVIIFLNKVSTVKDDSQSSSQTGSNDRSPKKLQQSSTEVCIINFDNNHGGDFILELSLGWIYT